MGATLSTGDQTWEVKVMGNLAQNNKKQNKIETKTNNKRQKEFEIVNHDITGDGQLASEQHLDKHCHPLGAAEVQ